MFVRSTFLFLLGFLFTTTSFAQRPGGVRPNNGGRTATGPSGGIYSPFSHTSNLMVHVVFENEHPAGQSILVQLEAAAGGIVSSKFTDAEGQVTFPGIAPGSYIVRIKGGDVQDTATDVLNLDSFDHTEFIHVRPVANEKTAVGSKEGSVSAATLNIPDKARKQFDKGNEALAKGENQKAIDYYLKAVELYPKYAMAFNNLGAAYMKSDDKIHAREAWGKALEADANLGTANLNVARLDMIEDNFKDAILPLEKALAVQPTNPQILLFMSEAQYMTGHLDDALLYARKVHAVEHQKFEMAHIIAGRVLESQNHPDQARVEYELLLKEDSKAPEATEARQSIARIDSVAKKQ